MLQQGLSATEVDGTVTHDLADYLGGLLGGY